MNRQSQSLRKQEDIINDCQICLKIGRKICPYPHYSKSIAKLIKVDVNTEEDQYKNKKIIKNTSVGNLIITKENLQNRYEIRQKQKQRQNYDRSYSQSKILSINTYHNNQQNSLNSQNNQYYNNNPSTPINTLKNVLLSKKDDMYQIQMTNYTNFSQKNNSNSYNNNRAQYQDSFNNYNNNSQNNYQNTSNQIRKSVFYPNTIQVQKQKQIEENFNRNNSYHQNFDTFRNQKECSSGATNYTQNIFKNMEPVSFIPSNNQQFVHRNNNIGEFHSNVVNQQKPLHHIVHNGMLYPIYPVYEVQIEGSPQPSLEYSTFNINTVSGYRFA